MKRKKKEHLHTFQLRSGMKPSAGLTEKIFRCIDPECWFYAKADFLVGKKAQCPICLKEYIINMESLRRKNPHCSNCTSGKRAEEEKVRTANIESALKDILGLN